MHVVCATQLSRKRKKANKANLFSKGTLKKHLVQSERHILQPEMHTERTNQKSQQETTSTFCFGSHGSIRFFVPTFEATLMLKVKPTEFLSNVE